MEGKIEQLLIGNKIGTKTKELHHLLCVVTNTDINYSTFRSHLNRMKKGNKIFQDKSRKWHLKIKPPPE